MIHLAMVIVFVVMLAGVVGYIAPVAVLIGLTGLSYVCAERKR